MSGAAPPHHVLLVQPMVDDDMPVPAWYMNSCDDMDNSNVELSSKSCTVTVSYGNSEAQSKIVVPCYKNTVALKKGDEIKVFREKKVAEKRAFAKLGDGKLGDGGAAAKKQR